MVARIIIILLVIGIAFVSVSVLSSLPNYRLSGNDLGYRPVQPIEYSHRRHAGELAIDCRYCHWNVDVSPHAAIPSVAVCMNCHTHAKPKDSQGQIKREVAKLLTAWDKQEPIVWEKVHDG